MQSQYSFKVPSSFYPPPTATYKRLQQYKRNRKYVFFIHSFYYIITTDCDIDIICKRYPDDLCIHSDIYIASKYWIVFMCIHIRFQGNVFEVVDKRAD